MEDQLATRLKAFLGKEKFTDIKVESTERSLTISADKEHLSAYFQLTAGKRGKGRKTSLFVPGPKHSGYDSHTKAPSIALQLITSQRK